jgi:hypothetical protein
MHASAFERIIDAAERYQVILEPDEDTPEWWAGAPSVVRGEDGTFYMAARMREGASPRGRRGYEVRLLASEDGHEFETIARIHRDATGVAGFERPALVTDPRTGRFRLYGCAGLDHGWAILKWADADHPADFDPATARPVLWADYVDDGFAHTKGYKDPFVMHDGDLWHLFVIGYDFVERAYHFLSADGERWEPASDRPVLENAGWHNFYTRPACVLPMAVGYLFVYEGSDATWRDPSYNIATGLAYTPDLMSFVDLTPHEPLLRSTTPGAYHTWRYSHWLRVGDEVYAYFEAARPNRTNEIRLAVFGASDAG